MEILPLLSPAEFSAACHDMLLHSRRLSCEEFNISVSYEETGLAHLQISRRVTTERSNGGHKEGKNEKAVLLKTEDVEEIESVEEVDEADELALHHASGPNHMISVEYSILLSPTYQVPVLYFHLHDYQIGPIHNIEAVYEYLVPQHAKGDVAAVGVMGGISMSNHPVTDVPCFFIHPCSTAEAMQDIIGSRPISPLEYLQIWVGLVGGYVGLYLPKELVIELTRRKETK